MKKTQRDKKGSKEGGSWKFFILMIAVLFITAGASFIYFKPRFSFESSFISDITSGNRKTSEETDNTDPGNLYKGSSPASSEEGDRQDSVLVIAEGVIREYIKPYNTQLLDLYVDKTGVIYIDLGDGLLKNFKGDAMEEFNIISGLYGKLKAAVPGFTAMKILIQGKEAESLGGHIDISKPIGEGIAAAIK
ncbi:MAG: hypothetical protein Q7U10_00515 [Thermodesulfovibrionia bacterium]|nr:hypothetical protein [Thermodesulfovibrionia bacterium]